MANEMGADAHDATDFANNASAFKSQGYSFVAQYIDQFSDANTGGSPSVTPAQIQQETNAGLKIVSIFQTNGMSSSADTGYQTYFTAAQGASDAQEALASATTLGQPPGSTIYFAMDFDPAIPGAAGTEANLLSEVRTYLGAVNTALTNAGYSVGVYGAGDTLAAAIRTNPPVAQYGWLTQSYGWAGSNTMTNPPDTNSQGWNIYQSFQTTANGVAIDPDTATSDSFGAWTVCYASGTLIRTARDQASEDVAVEALQIGDLVMTTSGEARPIKWLGHRKMDCRNHPDPRSVWPVRIAAHAFGANRPERDLTVSPGHSICVDVLGEVLIPACTLVNGATITQVEVDEITYWHVELDSHDILLANNLPAESYLEMGNRPFFTEAAGVSDRPDGPAPTHADFCRPFHADGALVEAVRTQLSARAQALGWTLEQRPFANVHLVVDGDRVEPEVSGLSARFLVPANARMVWLQSDTVVPHDIGHGDDRRRLGICVAQLKIDDGFDAPRVIAPDDDRLGAGFHEAEAGIRRWTMGQALLPAELWDGCKGAFFLRIDLAQTALPRWVFAADKAAVPAPTLRLVA